MPIATRRALVNKKTDPFGLPGFTYTKEPYATFVAGLSDTGCTVIDLGVSSDGSNHVWSLSYGDAALPCVFLEGVIHGAHEWHNALILRQFMDYLVHPPAGCDALIAELLANYRFYCVPCVNPYGYINNDYCNAAGVNLSINWDYDWAAYDDSGDVCANGKGASAFSELETQYLRDAVLAQGPALYFQFHVEGVTPPQTTNTTEAWHTAESDFWNAVIADFQKYGAKPDGGAAGALSPVARMWVGETMLDYGRKPLAVIFEEHQYLANWDKARYVLNWISFACQRGETWIPSYGTLQPDEVIGEDTSILEESPDNNYGISSTIALSVGYVAGKVRRGLLRFGLSWIAAETPITSAILTLYCSAEQDTTDRTVGVHRALAQWYEGLASGAHPADGTDASTWNHRNHNGAVAWGAAGGQSGVDYAAVATASTSITGIGYFTWDVTADVQAWIDGDASNYGWFLINTEETAISRKSFAVSKTTTVSLRPKLVVTFV